MNVLPPPQYQRLSPGLEPESALELPAYSRRRNTLAQPVAVRREPTEHAYHLVDGRNKPWAVLKIYSSAKSSKSLPTFFEKENVNGSLELNVERGDSIQAVSASITGRIITGANSDDCFTFLNHTVPIWSKSPDVPRLPSTSEGATGPKLTGQCVWPLSIPIPRTVTLPVNGASGEMQTFKLPETFLEKHTRASIQYDFSINISRGKLRADNRIKTPFGYVPGTRPDAPSMMRQLAYQQGCALPGPEVDPEGWKTLRPVPVRGNMFKSRSVEARCTLSLAKPLCFTRGTVIPCSLALDGQDTQLLDLLTSPGAINVVLRRRVRFYTKPSHFRAEAAWSENVEDVGSAVWWPSATSRSGSHSRHLDGEVKLAKDLRPTSSIGHFSISYSIVLCPFDMGNFTPASPADLLSEPVEIATLHGKGPRVLAYSPPSYDTPSRTHESSVYLGSVQGFGVVVPC